MDLYTYYIYDQLNNNYIHIEKEENQQEKEKEEKVQQVVNILKEEVQMHLINQIKFLIKKLILLLK